MKKPCGIYELANEKGRKSYKIFVSIDDLKIYLSKNSDKICELMKPVYIREKYEEFPNTKVKLLNEEEVERYLTEQSKG